METKDRGRASELAAGSSQELITDSVEVGRSKRPNEEEKELPQEDLQQMMMVVPVEKVYVEALQIKYPIIDWEVYSEDTRRDDLVKLWDLVKESDDTLWKLQRYMHNPLVWRLYDTCGVHHVSSVRGHDIFILVEKDYPLSKGVQMLMLGNKL
ncbi:hypothetical protein Tco_1354671, partial [Tanacetum coccineum]